MPELDAHIARRPAERRGCPSRGSNWSPPDSGGSSWRPESRKIGVGRTAGSPRHRHVPARPSFQIWDGSRRHTRTRRGARVRDAPRDHRAADGNVPTDGVGRAVEQLRRCDLPRSRRRRAHQSRDSWWWPAAGGMRVSHVRAGPDDVDPSRPRGARRRVPRRHFRRRGRPHRSPRRLRRHATPRRVRLVTRGLGTPRGGPRLPGVPRSPRDFRDARRVGRLARVRRSRASRPRVRARGTHPRRPPPHHRG